MKRIAALVLAVAMGGMCRAKDPYVGYIYPSGIQAGTTNCLLVGGHKMWWLHGMSFGCKGIRVLDMERMPGFTPPVGSYRRHLRKWLDGIAAGKKEEPVRPNDPQVTEWQTNRWWATLDKLDPLRLSLVERYLYVPRNPLQEGPSIRMVTLVTVAVDADVKPGRYDAFIWNDSGFSVPRPFFVTASPHVAEPLFRPAHRKQPETPLADVTEKGVVLDGQIFPATTDSFRLRLKGGCRYSVKVRAREFQPYVADAVPGFFNPQVAVENAAGKVIARADDGGRFRPDPSFSFTPPKNGVYTLKIRDVLYRGRADFVYAVTVTPVAAAPRSTDADAARKPKNGPRKFSGTVEKPGAVGTCTFTVEKPGPLVLDVTARRKGSSLDPVLTLRKASGGKPLARWDDMTNTVFVGTVPQEECDPVGTYDFKEPGRYTAEITDRTNHGGREYFWDLEIRPPKPDFKVYSTRSTLPLFRGRPLKVDFVIMREGGFDGSVTLTFPKDVRARNNVATTGVERISVVLTYTGKKPLQIHPVRVVARGRIGDKLEKRLVVPCDEQEQAFAWKHLVPAKEFIMRATPPRPKARKKAAPKKKPVPAAKKPGNGIAIQSVQGSSANQKSADFSRPSPSM